MQRGVLHTAVVPVHRRPVFQRLPGGQSLVVVGVHIAQEVPAGAGPLGHGVGFALGGAAAARAGGVDPVGHLGQGAFAVVGGLVGFHHRQHQGQLAFGQSHPAALLAVHQGDGLAPVALTGEDPVAQLVVDLLVAQAALLQPCGHGGDSLLDGHAVQEAGVDHDAGVVLEGEGALLDVAAGDDLNDVAAKDLGEFPVAVVMGRDGHDGAGAVGDEDVVGNEDRDLLAVDGVDSAHALDLHAGLFLVQLAALEVGFAGGHIHIGRDLVPVLNAILPLLEEGMLRGQDHIGGAEEGIAAGGVDHQIVAGGGLEGDLSADAAADPVALLDLDALDKVHIVQIVDQTLGILGDGQHPLALLLADDGGAAALANAVDHLFIGQHAFAAGAPVDGHGGLVGQAMLEHLQEDPLGPLVVVGVGGVHAAVPVEAVSQHLELAGEVFDVLLRHLGRMDMVLDGIVFRGKTEGVEADGKQHVIVLHPALAGYDVDGGEGARMAHVQALAGGIGELDQTVELFPGLIAVDGGEGLGLLPVFLPFLFDCGKVVFHMLTLSSSC